MEGLDLATVAGLFARQDASPFFVKDAALRYVAANPAMARLCGARDVAALLGHTAADFFPRAEALRYERLDAAVLAGRAVIDRLEIAAGRGRPAWLIFSRLPVRAVGGTVIGVAASARRLADAGSAHPGFARAATAVARLEARFDAPLDLAALAADCGVSPSQLERDFRGLFGIGPQRFLHRLRIERALERLAGGEAIAAIAHGCGYSDQSAFTRRFRAITGESPSAWRRHQRETP